MNYKLIYYLSSLLLLLSCGGEQKNNEEKQNKTIGYILLENPLDIKRTHEPVVITRDQLTDIPEDESIFISIDGEPIPHQEDDLDGDGKWDELAFLVDFEPNEKKKLTYETFADSLAIEFEGLEQYAHARLGYSATRNDTFVTVTKHVRPKNHEPQSKPMLYQFEGVGWENDKVGFRHYFDARNGKDIFGKTVSRMMLDSIGLPGTNYHEQQYWGMDILKVGNSLGAGAVALYANDTLYRLGETASATYELIADGPFRAIVRLTYTGWDVNGTVYDTEEEITIWAGKYGYQNKVTIKGNNNNIQLATGIVNLKDDGSLIKLRTDHNMILASYSQQSENNDNLGMGLIMHEGSYSDYFNAPKNGEVTDTYVAILNGKTNEPITYHFYAGWELSGFKKKETFLGVLQNEAKRIDAPILIKI